MICEITDNGRTWYLQEIDRPDGNLECYLLYDSNGDFAGEYDTVEDAMEHIRRGTE